MQSMTMAEARALNERGVPTGGCWRCIQNAIGERGSRGELTENAKTQWRMDDMKFIGHRQFCPAHYRQEMVDARGF